MERRFAVSEPPRYVAAIYCRTILARNAMSTRRIGPRFPGIAALCAAIAISCIFPVGTLASWSTVVDNGTPSNRVDVVFVGDGYTRSDLESGLYAGHVEQYLDYMFGASGYLADPFPRYKNFFNVHQVDVVSTESGADHPAQGIYRNTALNATYDSNGIGRLLTINTSLANSVVNQNLFGTGITPDIRLATVNDATYGGSGGTWAVYAGPNSQARDIALHELSHAFSKTLDEYVTASGAYPGGEPSAVNVTKDPTGAKWSQWLGYVDPRAGYLNIGVFQGAADYPTGIYRPSLDSKMRTLGRPFNAVVREKSILDIYRYVDPLDAWFENGAPIEEGTLWVDTVDPEVIAVDWYVDDELVAADYGEQFNLAAFGFAAGTFHVRAHAYDEVLRHVGDGTLLDLVRRDLDKLQQDVAWTVNFAGSVPFAGDYNLNGVVDDADLLVWKDTFGSTVELAADGNGDGMVDAADYTLWRDNLGTSAVGFGNSGGNVPEPNFAVLAASILVSLFATGRGRPAARRTVSPPPPGL